MPFDFDSVVNRNNTDSIKWNGQEKFLTPAQLAANPLPMWVADMDFRSPPAVIEALQDFAAKGVFGYPMLTQGHKEAILAWQKKRFQWEPKEEWLVQTPGVVTAINNIVQAFTRPGDTVLVQTPVYMHFHYDVMQNGRHVAYAPLVLEDNQYRFDAHIFEKAIQPNTKLFILCNPHNPTGNVWSVEDLRQMGDICARHGILVVSDEIHQDLVVNRAKKHIPFASLGTAFAENSIVCTAPSKTFNIAGLQCSNLFIANAKIREEFQRQLERNGLYLVNAFGAVASEAAYRYGEPWLEELLDYLAENHRFLAQEIHTKIPSLKVIPADSLYLAWMDCRSLGLSPEVLNDTLLRKAGVWLDRGEKFGPEGHGFMRVNLGCPRSTLKEMVSRLQSAIGTL